MRNFLFLEEFAARWCEDSVDTMEEARAEILRMFWEGKFERMGPKNGPGTILATPDESRVHFPDQEFTRMPFGREHFLWSYS